MNETTVTTTMPIEALEALGAVWLRAYKHSAETGSMPDRARADAQAAVEAFLRAALQAPAWRPAP